MLGNKLNSNGIESHNFSPGYEPASWLTVDIILCMYVCLYIYNIMFREIMQNTGQAEVELSLSQL
jgi:hypothetical protein